MIFQGEPLKFWEILVTEAIFQEFPGHEIKIEVVVTIN